MARRPATFMLELHALTGACQSDAFKRKLWPDADTHDSRRRDYEALMRKVLQYPRQPAVIALYWFSTGTRHRFYENSQDDMDVIARCVAGHCADVFMQGAVISTCKHAPGSCNDRNRQYRNRHQVCLKRASGFRDGSAQIRTVLSRCQCSYYGIPSVSWRDAAFHLMLAGEPGFLHEDVYYDRGHPNADVGHR